MLMLVIADFPSQMSLIHARPGLHKIPPKAFQGGGTDSMGFDPVEPIHFALFPLGAVEGRDVGSGGAKIGHVPETGVGVF